VKSQLVIHSPESKIEYFTLPRVENNKVMGVADENAPEALSRRLICHGRRRQRTAYRTDGTGSDAQIEWLQPITAEEQQSDPRS
jgi:hypothetical protein